MIIDTHVHLDVSKFTKDIEKVLERARNNGVERFIIPAIESDNMEGILKLVEANDDIYFSVGNHPNRLDNFDMEQIEKYVSHEKCVAIGECGLDYYRVSQNNNINVIQKEIARQKKTFEKQLQLAVKYKKPVILHSRDTDEDMVDMVSKYGKDLVGGVVHCYVGSIKLLELEKFNFYYGIGGVLTYKSATDLRNNVKRVPFHKLLIETDAPYLTPVPNRGKRNEPSYTPFVVKELSKILQMNKDIVENKCYQNTLRLFWNQ